MFADIKRATDRGLNKHRTVSDAKRVTFRVSSGYPVHVTKRIATRIAERTSDRIAKLVAEPTAERRTNVIAECGAERFTKCRAKPHPERLADHGTLTSSSASKSGRPPLSACIKNCLLSVIRYSGQTTACELRAPRQLMTPGC